MTRKEAIIELRAILAEAVESENSVCYVTEEDREPLEMAIKALEQEPCEDAISRQEALGCCRNEWEEEVEIRLKSLPSVAVLVLKGGEEG